MRFPERKLWKTCMLPLFWKQSCGELASSHYRPVFHSVSNLALRESGSQFLQFVHVYTIHGRPDEREEGNPEKGPNMVNVVYATIGVAIPFMHLCVGFYVRRDLSRAVISTTEWVRFMRKNDIRYVPGTNMKQGKAGSS